MRVAIVDDNDVNLMLHKRMLKQHFAIEAHTFNRAWPGLEWCLSEDPDLVLVDYMMPELDGLAFIAALRAAPQCAETPVLMVTANHEREICYQALEVGANDFLTKPVDQPEFCARVRNMLALRKARLADRERAEWLAVEVKKATAEVVNREQEAIILLSRAAEYRDPETGAHILRMAAYSALIAEEIDLPRDQIELIHKAAPMHDIGKVGTPDRVLLKPGRLDPDELAIMRQHAQIGHDILVKSDAPLLQCAATIALSHHERFDGSGYPRRLAGDDIPLVGRIVAIADVFDALMSSRPYKPAWQLDKALTLLKEERGRHFDPRLLDAFFNRLEDVEQIRQTHLD